jgi:hypothetical protein
MLRHSRSSAIKRRKRVIFGVSGRLDRTQEVAGSSPASSIVTGPGKRGPSTEIRGRRGELLSASRGSRERHNAPRMLRDCCGSNRAGHPGSTVTVDLSIRPLPRFLQINDLAFGIRIATMLPVTMSSRAASRWGRPADEVASFRMTRVRLRDTCPELLLRSILHRSGRPPRARALDSRARGHCVSAGPPKPTSCHRAARGSAKVLSFRAPARRGSSCQIHHSYGGVCG